MGHKAVNGLVVRAVEYKEADLILTVLTEGEGKLTVTARGARRRNTPHAAAAQVLCYSRFVLSEYRERLTVKEAEIIESFHPLRGDLLSMSLACYLADLAQTLAPEGDSLRLLLVALSVLSAGKRPHTLVKAAFELRVLCDAGFEPALDRCGRCGGVSAVMYLLPSRGTAVCSDCAQAARDEGGPLLAFDTDGLLAARHIRSAPVEKVFSFTLSEQALARLAALCERYTLTQTDRALPSLEFYLGLL